MYTFQNVPFPREHRLEECFWAYQIQCRLFHVERLKKKIIHKYLLPIGFISIHLHNKASKYIFNYTSR